MGCKLSVGSNPVLVTQLARWKIAGNTGSHTVKLVRASDGVDVPGGSVSVNVGAGTAGTFVYATLGTVVVLAANTDYYVVSQETNGGNTWYNNNQAVTGMNGISVVKSVWSAAATPAAYTEVSGANVSYVPVGLKGKQGTWDTSAETRYVYDGMRVLQERTSSNVPQVTYTRGLDLSGSFEGAGGIGGLLARTAHSGGSGGTYTPAFYHADGNGNVTYLLTAGQTLGASYKYDPYGRNLSSSGSLSAANTYQFSSKLLTLAGYYYGYRFYDPNTQRWLNRDPIQEDGGYNLYRIAYNNPVMFYDPLGHAWTDIIPGWIDVPANFCAGAADNLTGGLTDGLREKWGLNDEVNKDSPAYKAGDTAATAGQLVGPQVGMIVVKQGGKQLGRAVAKKAAEVAAKSAQKAAEKRLRTWPRKSAKILAKTLGESSMTSSKERIGRCNS